MAEKLKQYLTKSNRSNSRLKAFELEASTTNCIW